MAGNFKVFYFRAEFYTSSRFFAALREAAAGFYSKILVTFLPIYLAGSWAGNCKTSKEERKKETPKRIKSRKVNCDIKCKQLR